MLHEDESSTGFQHASDLLQGFMWVVNRTQHRCRYYGIGRFISQALRQAHGSPGSMAGAKGLPQPIVVFEIFDEVTEHASALLTAAVGMSVDGSGRLPGSQRSGAKSMPGSHSLKISNLH